MSGVAALAKAVRVAAAGVTHRYGPRLALEPVDFELGSPGVVAVTGANGSGKSTLLRILCGLLRPSGGTTTVVIDGVAIEPRKRREHVGLATPELAFYEEFTARENLSFAATTRGMPAVHSAVERALERVGLESRARDLVGDFSSGMKQRLRLGFAVLHEPAILLLDEPGSHLDDEGRAIVERLVQAYGAHSLVVLATNEPREMELGAKRIELRGRGLGNPS